MKNQSLVLRTTLVLTLFFSIVIPVAAQGSGNQEPVRGDQDVLIRKLPDTGQVGPMFFNEQVMAGRPGDVTYSFVSSEMSFGDKVIKGAPYSAEAVTEMIQVLSDGNRIVRKNSSSIYRDSEGRIRREQTLAAIGPWAADEPKQLTFINDPVAGVNYVLEPDTKTARKLPLPPSEGQAPMSAGVMVKSGTEAEIHSEVIKIAPGVPVGGTPALVEHGVAQHQFLLSDTIGDTKSESLGKQQMEGLEVEGTRTTTTIPAGKIGNELPIQIVAEQWTSPALQVMVMSKHNDPRFGETTYRLTNINRSEPVKTLFEVPADYTVKDAPRMFTRKIIRHSGDSNQDSSDSNQP